MGGTKTQTTQQQQQTQANTYEYKQAPTTPELQDVKTAAQRMKDTFTPIVKGQYAGARQDLDDSFLNPAGAYTTPAMRDAALQAGHENLHQQESTALIGAEGAENDADYQRKLQLAQMTNPQLVQTGGSSTGAISGTSQQSGGLAGQVLTSAASGSGAALL